MNVHIATQLESEVRSYCRSFPTEFSRAEGAQLHDTSGKEYLDFLSGCGSLNYGHNNPVLKERLVSYITSSGISMSLDFFSQSKNQFIKRFDQIILKPRKLDYRLQFCGPTGTNAVEAALKLARKVTGRWPIIAFTNGFHGCSLGALAATGSHHHRKSSEALLTNVIRLPYDNYLGEEFDTLTLFEKMVEDASSGLGLPAAILVEGVQGEGGLNVASSSWLKKLSTIAKKKGILLILDEIQTGCGRTGDFFSFEASNIVPDMVVLAKSISGYGLPLSLVLFRPDLDCWEPGEHNGTFRGNNLAFVTGEAALEHFWKDPAFTRQVQSNISLLTEGLKDVAGSCHLNLKGKGMMQGINMVDGDWCANIRRKCFDAGLIIEAAGPNDEILKVMPPINIPVQELERGLAIIKDVIISNPVELPAAV